MDLLFQMVGTFAFFKKYMLRFLYSLLFVYLSISSISAQEYLWPTDASQWITSTFGEHRPRRLHAAIDIKTWARSGYKIFAVRDGYVSRIRVSPYGYGKAIYLKLDTGEIVVYAHLSGFNHELTQFVLGEQERNNKYRVDRYLSSTAFPVKKGDFLGYTGDTGIGVAHLHFEMRDAENRPFNPFLKGFAINDTESPTPSHVAFIPLKPFSRINDDFITQVVSLRKNAGSDYQLTKKIHFDGTIGIAVKAYDQSGAVTNKFSIYKLSLFVDDRLMFSSTYDKFSYPENRFIDLDRDYRLRQRGYGKFYRLFLDPDNNLDFYKWRGPEKGRLIFDELTYSQLSNSIDDSLRFAHEQNGWRGNDTTALRLKPGSHNLVIVLEDFFNNTTTITGEIVAGKRFAIRPHFAVVDSQIVLQNVDYPKFVEHAVISAWERSLHRRTHWQPLALNHQLDGASGLQPPIPLFTQVNNKYQKAYKFLVTDKHQTDSWPFFLHIPQEHPSSELKLHLESDFYDDFVRVMLKTNMPLQKRPLIEITLDDGSTQYPVFYQSEQMVFLIPIKLADIPGRNVRLSISGEGINRQVASIETTFDNMHMKPGTYTDYFSADSVLKISFAPNTAYQDMFIRVRKSADRDLRDPDMLSDAYLAQPGDVPMNQGATVSMKLPDSLAYNEQIGLYFKSGRRWVYLSNRFDEVSRRLFSSVLSLEEFAIRQDVEAPTVQIIRPKRNETLRPNTSLLVRSWDEQTGFNSEESLYMEVDGRKCIAEYDPEKRRLLYVPRTPFTSGQHQFRFTSTDRAGNVTEVIHTFYIK